MSKFLVGLFLGLMTGWVAGILSAPQSGSETMEFLGERALDLKDRAARKADAACEDIVLDC
jgi:gas vesicle protein